MPTKRLQILDSITKQVDWNQTDETQKDFIKNKPDIIPVPTTASVGQTIIVKSVDENGKPTEWEAVDTPTKVSEFVNDAGYLTEHQDLSDYALKEEIPDVPVKSVNGKTGDVVLTPSDIGAQAAGDYALNSELKHLAFADTVTKTDLESSVQASLGKADTALQSFEETDPTVPDWAKAETKPTYTYEEVGADASGTAATIISEHNTATDAHSDIRNAISSITPESIGAAETVHHQAADTIVAGTFAGEVIANASAQTPTTALLRNSKLVTSETNPTNNGEICWMYE